MKLGKAFLLAFLLFLFEPLIAEPITYAEEPGDTVWIVALSDSLPVDSLPVGTSLRMSVEATNSVILGKIIMKFDFKESDLVRLDSISFSDPSCRLNDTTLDQRDDTTNRTASHIEIEYLASAETNYLPIGSGKIFDLWFFSIKAGIFYIDKTQPIEFYGEQPPVINPAFFPDSLNLSSYADPDSADCLWIKKGVVYDVHDTIGIKAKFPLPFTAYNDEVLSGLQIPLLMLGDNIPIFDSVSFVNTSLTDTTNLLDVDASASDTTLIKLELKKPELTDTLLLEGTDNRLFDLWFEANDSAGVCTLKTDFVPYFGDLFFIDSVGGFTPSCSVFVCTTFSYVEGDITKNDVANNVDLFYLAMHLFLPLEDTSSGELSYDPEDLERIQSQRIFETTSISSEEWDGTFSEILFRGDVNADSRVDVGDFYIMSRFFQADTAIVQRLKYGWSDPQSVKSSDSDFVKINFQTAHPDQDITILVEIYNKDSLAALTLPLQLDTTKLVCNRVTLAGKFDTLLFDWEWMTWDEDYDQDTTNQDLLIVLSTLGSGRFPHIPPSEPGKPDSAFILWCTVKALLDTSDYSYLDCVSLLPSHQISFFDTGTGYIREPQLKKSVAKAAFADYGDAPDGTNLYYANYYFPTLYNTNFSRIEGRRGPYHEYTGECTEWLGFSTDPCPTKEWTGLIEDMDADSLSEILYVEGTTGWYIAPVTVTADPDTIRYLNVLYDVNGDSTWKNDEYTEWVVQNKLIIPDTTTDTTSERIILGPFDIQQAPSSSTPAWARFTLTRDPISTEMFDTVGGWDGSGPDTGWDYGETEDILFETTKALNEFVCFSVDLDDSFEVPEGGRDDIEITVSLVGTEQPEISGLSLNCQVFDSTGVGRAVVCSCVTSSPGGWDPDSFDLGIFEPKPQIITFTYHVGFPDSVNERTCRVVWKVTMGLGDGTKLVATDETKFKESANPYFVFLYASGDPVQWQDTTISHYGGAVDLRFLVVDPDSDYDIAVTFDRDTFQHAVYAPIFGESKSATEISVSGPNDTSIFLWAADSTEIGDRTAIFKAKDKDEDSTEAVLTIQVSDDSSYLPPQDKVWVGRTGVVGQKDFAFKVPVEVYNKDTLNAIKLPFQIIGHIDTLLGWSFDVTTRLYSDSVLTLRGDTIPDPRVHTDTVITRFYRHPEEGYYGLSPGFGKIFDLWFKGDTTCFYMNPHPLRPIEFSDWNGNKIDPAFESHEIRVIERLEECDCGDCDGSGFVEVVDVVCLVNYVMKSGADPACSRVDVNCDGKVDIVDVVYLVNYLFKGGPLPCDPEPPPDGDGVLDC